MTSERKEQIADGRSKPTYEEIIELIVSQKELSEKKMKESQESRLSFQFWLGQHSAYELIINLFQVQENKRNDT